MIKRPNILLITTDQQRADHLGLEGLKAVQTPNLDRLGREGLYFKRGYTCSPVCTPARVSLLTGKYPSRHGAYSIGVSTDLSRERTLPSLLADVGYRTALFGKSHFVERKKEIQHISGQDNPGPDFFRAFDGPYLGFDKVALSSGHTINAVPEGHYRCFLEDAAVDYKQWFPQLGPDYDHDATGVWDIPVVYHDSTWVGNCTTEFITSQATSAKPWFAWTSLQDPHEPHVCPKEWMDRVDVPAMVIPEEYRDGEFDDKPWFYRQAYEEGNFGSIDDAFGTPCAGRRQALTDKRIEALHATLGMIAGIDDQVGRILDALETAGQAENTIIIFTSDHGEYHGHHGFWGKGLPAYEDIHRVPFLIWGPGWIKKAGPTNALASLIDLPKTILDLAGATAPVGMQGVSLVPIFNGQIDHVQEDVLIELRAVETFSQHSLITDRYKLVVYETLEEGELYDLQEDPNQYRNLWHEPDHLQLKAGLLQRLARHYQAGEGVRTARTSFA